MLITLAGCGWPGYVAPGRRLFDCATAGGQGRLSFNLDCPHAWQDSSAPYGLAVPAGGLFSTPVQVSFYANEPDVSYYYRLNGFPDYDDGDLYTSSFYVGSAARLRFSTANTGFRAGSEDILRYFAVDTAGNRQEVQAGLYEFQSGLPGLQITGADGIVGTDDSTVTLTLVAAGADEIIVRTGSHNQSSGSEVLRQSIIDDSLEVETSFHLSAIEEPGLGEVQLYARDSASGRAAMARIPVFIDNKAAYTNADPPPGIYNTDLELSLVNIEGARIYYTTDLSDPLPVASNLYSGPITLSSDTLVKVISVDLAGNIEEERQLLYTIDKTPPALFFSVYSDEAALQPAYYTGGPFTVSRSQLFGVEWQSDERGDYRLELGGAFSGDGVLLDSGSLAVAAESIFSVYRLEEAPAGAFTLNLYMTDQAGNETRQVIEGFLDDQIVRPRLIRPLIFTDADTDLSDGEPAVFSWSDIEAETPDSSSVVNYGLEVAHDIAFTNTVDFAGDPLSTCAADMGPVARQCSFTFDSPGRYFVRVFAEDGVGNYAESIPRQVMVSTPLFDLDGDGLGEFAVGAYKYSAESGRVYIYRGRPDNSDPVLYAVIDGAQAGDRFGFSVALLYDVNGDGEDELLVGAPGQTIGSGPQASVGQGGAYLFTASSLYCPSPPCSFSSAVAARHYTSGAANDRFGHALASAGDFNADGYGDFAIGATNANGTDTGSGAVYLHLGGATLPVSHSLVFAGEVNSDAFGSALVHAGDLNGDSFSDLAVGAPYARSVANSTGAVYVFYGSAAPAAGHDLKLVASDDTGAEFGSSLARGFDTGDPVDGFEDLIAGSPRNSTLCTGGPATNCAHGKAFVFFGSDAMLSVPGYQFSINTPGALMGSAVLSLRISADSNDSYDLLTSVPGLPDDLSYNGSSVFLVPGESLANPDFDNPSDVAVFTGRVEAGLPTQFGFTMGLLGEYDTVNLKSKDIFAVGDCAAETVSLYAGDALVADKIRPVYESDEITPVVLSAGSGGGFGCSITSRP